jgi:hypothetical protein
LPKSLIDLEEKEWSVDENNVREYEAIFATMPEKVTVGKLSKGLHATHYEMQQIFIVKLTRNPATPAKCKVAIEYECKGPRIQPYLGSTEPYEFKGSFETEVDLSEARSLTIGRATSAFAEKEGLDREDPVFFQTGENYQIHLATLNKSLSRIALQIRREPDDTLRLFQRCFKDD